MMEQNLCKGLNDRLNRGGSSALVANTYTTAPNPAFPSMNTSSGFRRMIRNKDGEFGESPVLRFYWGYSAPAGQEKDYLIALRNFKDESPWEPLKDKAAQRGPFYWGGGPFVNGTTDLPSLWSKRGFKKHVGKVFNLQSLNTQEDRQLQDAPPRDYYAHAVQRLADLIDKIRTRHKEDTITLIAHSQGTMLAMAATLACKTRAPDALFVMNSPYRLEDIGIDFFQLGWERSTPAARVNTFEAVAKRIKDDRKSYSDFGGCLNVGVTAAGALWRDDVMGANDTPERDNNGRMYVYFNPHDRVMGMTALKSTGWQGVPKAMLDNKEYNLYQRMLARSSPCGDAPGFQNFGTLPLVRPADVDKATGKPVKPGSFWNGNLLILSGAGGPLWSTPDPSKQVFINAEKVPVPLTSEDLNKFDVYLNEKTETMGEINSETGTYKDSEFIHLVAAYQPEKYFTVTHRTDMFRTTQVRETRAQLKARLEQYRPIPTNHSTLPMHGPFIQQVVAYDVPIGFCYSGLERDFWAELIQQADWMLADDMYWFTGKATASSMPSAIDTETITSAMQKKRDEEELWRGG
ncbi:alpha/beta hydrolase [Glaciimonas sp. PAMC28666]|uniref:alpha/beta hydrolase n=1 Tax=Glaciimonas sp. PAMC28666 TaxID=2807626 RepID=UPI0019656EAC|nr:alpha/beta hydrolase [Glaciimonas sp. PAMC28666]QRX83115.1 alpha/beta hydrolase [Glaciimonas sp. PAMC28666]